MRLHIQQAWYEASQTKHLDPAFTPLDNSANPHPDWAEYYLFLQHYGRGNHLKADLTGILSWRFGEKTRIPGERFVRFIENHPGYDVYFINPWPAHSEQFSSVWKQGERCHPGLIRFTQQAFDALQVPVNVGTLRHSAEQTLFCNYWVGTPQFWRRYMEFTRPVHNWMAGRLADPAYSSHVARQHPRPMTNHAFVLERMFTTLLATTNGVQYRAYTFTDDEMRLHRSRAAKGRPPAHQYLPHLAFRLIRTVSFVPHLRNLRAGFLASPLGRACADWLKHRVFLQGPPPYA